MRHVRHLHRSVLLRDSRHRDVLEHVRGSVQRNASDGNGPSAWRHDRTATRHEPAAGRHGAPDADGHDSAHSHGYGAAARHDAGSDGHDAPSADGHRDTAA
jgi:hypothetical protein